MKKVTGLVVLSLMISVPALAGHFVPDDEAGWDAWMRDTDTWGPDDAFPTSVNGDGNLVVPVGRYQESDYYGLYCISTGDEYAGPLVGDIASGFTGSFAVVVRYRLVAEGFDRGDAFAITDFVACSHGDGVASTTSLVHTPQPELRVTVELYGDVDPDGNHRDQFFSEPVGDSWFGANPIKNGVWRELTIVLEPENFARYWGGPATDYADYFNAVMANVEYMCLDFDSGFWGCGGFAFAEDGRVTSGYVEISDFRLVAIPEPATMGLLALGGLALLRRRK